MKNQKIFSVLIFLPVLALVFLGCSLAPSDGSESGLRIIIDSPTGSLRTISPKFDPKPDFKKYEILLLGQGATTTDYSYTATSEQRHNPKLTNVVYGTYSINVRAYLSASDSYSNNSAEGTVLFTFNENNRIAVIKLGPVTSNGNGTLKYKLTDTAGTVSYATLIDYSDLDEYLYVEPEPYPDPEAEYPYYLPVNTEDFDYISLPSGYYALILGYNAYEIVHIYRNFESIADLEITTPDKVAAPVATPGGGIIAYGTTVELSCATMGAAFYYTTDDSEPTMSSEQYSGPITLPGSPVTIRAFAFIEGMRDSNEISETYTIKASAPTAAPAGGIVAPGSTITLSTAVAGAVIYYTTDDTDPATYGIVYNGPIAITSSPTNVRAFAAKDGMIDSEELTETYKFKVATPTASPSTGATVLYGSTVSLSCTTAGATIYYTTDNSHPLTSGTKSEYSAPIAITKDPTTIRSIAVMPGQDDSDERTAIYNILTSTVTFNENYAGGSSSSVSVFTGTSTGGKMPAAPGRSGYTFIEWNTAQGGNGTVFDGTEIITANTTVYAQWEVNPWGEFFIRNGEIKAIQAQSGDAGSKISSLKNDVLAAIKTADIDLWTAGDVLSSYPMDKNPAFETTLLYYVKSKLGAGNQLDIALPRGLGIDTTTVNGSAITEAELTYSIGSNGDKVTYNLWLVPVAQYNVVFEGGVSGKINISDGSDSGIAVSGSKSIIGNLGPGTSITVLEGDIEVSVKDAAGNPAAITEDVCGSLKIYTFDDPVSSQVYTVTVGNTPQD